MLPKYKDKFDCATRSNTNYTQCNYIVNSNFNGSHSLIKCCASVFMYLQHINSNNSYIYTPVRCEYLNYWLHHNVPKINEITDHIKKFYNKLIKAYNSCSPNLNVCHRNGVNTEKEGLEK